MQKRRSWRSCFHQDLPRCSIGINSVFILTIKKYGGLLGLSFRGLLGLSFRAL